MLCSSMSIVSISMVPFDDLKLVFDGVRFTTLQRTHISANATNNSRDMRLYVCEQRLIRVYISEANHGLATEW